VNRGLLPGLDVFLKVDNDGTEIRLGNWGACARAPGASDWSCTGSSVGYSDDDIRNIGTTGSDISGTLVPGLSGALILHPIAVGFATVAMTLAVTKRTFTKIWPTLSAAFAFFVCLVAFIVDSVLFVIAYHRINDYRTLSSATLGNSYWMVLASTVSLLVGTVVLAIGYRWNRRNGMGKTAHHESGNHASGRSTPSERPSMGQKNKFWQRINSR